MNKLSLLALLSAALSFGSPHFTQAAEPAAHVQFVPERADDIAWENDRIAFRIYGPRLGRSHPTGSGIDVWTKSVNKLVVADWYKRPDYHKDEGEGLDFYAVGPSRGTGGLGIWDGKTLYTSGHWASYEIKETDGARAVFSVRYAPWKIQDEHEISEDRTFTLATGTNLNEITATFQTDLPEFVVGIGIAKNGKGEVFQDKEKGILAYWPAPHPQHGSVGSAVLVDPADVVGFAEDAINHLILVKAKPGISLKYRAGACWSKTPEFNSFANWKEYLLKQPRL